MTVDEKVAELSGRLASLEKLLLDVVMGQLVEVKLKCINAENVAVRAAESVNEVLSSLPVESSEMGASKGGYLDVRRGAMLRAGEDEDGDA